MFLAMLIQACNGPDTPRPVAPTPQKVSNSQPPPETTQDSQYISLLNALAQRNPETEAQQALTKGEYNLMSYYAGRGGLKLPGLSPQQQTSQRCPLKTLDGLGDVIYGENHLKYRVALRNFAKAYNLTMLPACL